MRAALEAIGKELRAHPVEMSLHLGTIAATGLLFLGVIGALASGAPSQQTSLLVGVIALGALVVVVWTVLVPGYGWLQQETDEHVPVEDAEK